MDENFSDEDVIDAMLSAFDEMTHNAEFVEITDGYKAGEKYKARVEHARVEYIRFRREVLRRMK